MTDADCPEAAQLDLGLRSPLLLAYRFGSHEPSQQSRDFHDRDDDRGHGRQQLRLP